MRCHFVAWTFYFLACVFSQREFIWEKTKNKRWIKQGKHTIWQENFSQSPSWFHGTILFYPWCNFASSRLSKYSLPGFLTFPSYLNTLLNSIKPLISASISALCLLSQNLLFIKMYAIYLYLCINNWLSFHLKCGQYKPKHYSPANTHASIPKALCTLREDMEESERMVLWHGAG